MARGGGAAALGAALRAAGGHDGVLRAHSYTVEAARRLPPACEARKEEQVGFRRCACQRGVAMLDRALCVLS